MIDIDKTFTYELGFKKISGKNEWGTGMYFNYKDDFSGLLEKWLPLAKDRLTYSLTFLNHSILSEKAATIANGGETIFAGEISDGAHNLGFSQYFSIFHP